VREGQTSLMLADQQDQPLPPEASGPRLVLFTQRKVRRHSSPKHLPVSQRPTDNWCSRSLVNELAAVLRISRGSAAVSTRSRLYPRRPSWEGFEGGDHVGRRWMEPDPDAHRQTSSG